MVCSANSAHLKKCWFVWVVFLFFKCSYYFTIPQRLLKPQPRLCNTLCFCVKQMCVIVFCDSFPPQRPGLRVLSYPVDCFQPEIKVRLTCGMTSLPVRIQTDGYHLLLGHYPDISHLGKSINILRPVFNSI